MALGAVVILGANAGGQTAMRFTERTAEAGLTHAHALPNNPRLGVMTAGGAVADFDRDGWLDLFVLGGGGAPDRLFMNNGLNDAMMVTFTDVAEQAGVAGPRHSFGVSAADYNNDGWIDLYVTSYGPTPGQVRSGQCILFENNGPDEHGNISFTNVTELCGLDLPGVDTRTATGSAWGDVDLDGDLDFFITSYRDSHLNDRLMRNDGPDALGLWQFTDITDQMGVDMSTIRGFIPGFTDMNGDRYPEILLVADSSTSRYLVNLGPDGDGGVRFADRSDDVFDLYTANGMGSAVGDVNGDGLLDWYVSSIYYPTLSGPGNLLLIQQPDGTFHNIAFSAGVADGAWGWGTLIVDLDHDSWPDLVETNGYGQFPNVQSFLHPNDGTGLRYDEVAIEAGFVHYGQGRGLIDADFDNDGDQDLVIFSNGQPLAFFRNELLQPGQPVPAGRHWLKIELDTSRRDTLAPDGFGTLLTISSASREQVATIDGGYNHCSTGEHGAHFGLGYDTTVDWIRVRWNDGSFTTLADVPADQKLIITAPYHPADVDASGDVGIDDVLWFVRELSDGRPTADHDGNGQVDFFDVSAFLRDFRNANG